MELPGYLSWFGVEQILWVFSKIMDLIYEIVPNVGAAIIIYALLSHVVFLPFTIKQGIDQRKNKKIQEELLEIKKEYLSLPEEEREKEEVKKIYRDRQNEVKKKKGSTTLGCLVVFLRLFILISTTPVISFIDYYLNPAADAYNFLGFNLNTTPGFGSVISVISFIFPLLTTLILSISGFLSTRKTLKAQKDAQENKTKEEKEEEAEMLKEMGIKESKIPWGYVIQIMFTCLYFYTFSQAKLTVCLYWGTYYLFERIIRGIITYGFPKSVSKLFKGKSKECARSC